MQPAAHIAVLAALRSKVARLERRGTAGCREKVVSFGLTAVDAALPAGGLALGASHELAGTGCQVEHGTAAALLAAGLLAQVPGEVLWVLEQADIHPPALAAVGLTPKRVVYVHARKPQTVLLVMEEGLHHRGLAGVVAEFSGALGLTASRRLQLAAGHSGVTAWCSSDPTRWRHRRAITAGGRGSHDGSGQRRHRNLNAGENERLRRAAGHHELLVPAAPRMSRGCSRRPSCSGCRRSPSPTGIRWPASCARISRPRRPGCGWSWAAASICAMARHCWSIRPIVLPTRNCAGC